MQNTYLESDARRAIKAARDHLSYVPLDATDSEVIVSVIEQHHPDLLE